LAIRRKYVLEAVLLLLGAGLGATLAWYIAYVFQLWSGQTELQNYAQRLLRTGISLAQETDIAVNTVLDDKLPFCSDQELALMRQFVFNATQVKDIGRTRNGKLYCTTGIGRIVPPYPTPAPNMVVRGIRFTVLAPIMISPQAKGFIVENGGVSVVLNPEAYKVLDEPPMLYSGFLYDPIGQRAMHVIGHDVPISSAEVVAQRLIERNGVFYQPVCAQAAVVCDIAIEPRAAMLAQDRVHVLAFVIGGSLLGGSFVLIFILFYHRQRSFERRLRRAIRRGKLQVAYQPIVDLGTRTIVGAEALARWINESDEHVPPDQFIAVAEERGFIGEITRFVVERAIEELGDLLSRSNFRITVNISSQDLTDAGFFFRLEHSISAAKISPSTIGLELTERSTADQAVVTDAISRLKSSGHRVYIDDFGTGYSSLSYLHHLAADAIKIDRTFTGTVGTEAVTASVVPQILDIANQLHLMVVVEGIETEEQANYFRGTGAGILGQGWLFGKPVSAARFKKLFHGNHDPA
jgi:sensor c-di-GMP phosphodiesterase-like protein